MDTIITHIPGLDEYLGGGLPSSIYLVMGVPGSGIRTFIREITYRRALENNISYVSLNSNKKVIQREMMEYGFDIAKFLEEKRIKIISEVESDCVINLLIKEIKQNRSTVLDSISDLFIEQGSSIAINLVKRITEETDDTFPHFLLLTEGMQDLKTEIALQHYSKGVIHFSSLFEKESIIRYITFRKLPWGIGRDKTIPYSISDTGIKIETSLRIT